MFNITADEVFRDFETDGVPSSGLHRPRKPKIRELLGSYEANIQAAFVSGSSVIFSSKAAMDASLDYPATTLAWVVGDAIAANNGIYQKLGSSGSGSWTRKADLPYSFIRLSDSGAGTANAIQLTSSLPTSPSVMRVANVFEANTGNVTISENGGAARSLRTNSNNEIQTGGLAAGMMIVYVDDGTNFRLISDQTSSAIVAAAEAAALAAQAAASSVVPNIFATKAAAEAYSPTVAPTFLNTAFYDTDQVPGSGAEFRRNGTTTGDLVITLADGVTEVGYDLRVSEYHPAMFGAKVNGVTNDAAAWQAAINTAFAKGGGIVTAPVGNTVLAASIELKSNVTLRGAGKSSKIKLANGASGSLYNDGSQNLFIYAGGSTNYASVENLYIDGNATNNSTISVGIALGAGTNLSVRNVLITDYYGTAIAALATTGFYLDNINIEDQTGNFPGNNPGEGIYVRDAARGLIKGLRGKNIDDHLVYLSGSSSVGSADIIVSDAIGYNCGRVSKSSAFNVFQNVTRFKFSDCHSMASGMGFTCVPDPSGTYFPTDGEWMGCTAYDSDSPSSEAHGFSLSGPAGRSNSRHRLVGCKAHGNGIGAAVVASGFSIYGIDDIELIDCTASNNNDSGFDLANVTNFKLDVRALNNSRRSTGAFNGISIGGVGTAGFECSGGEIRVLATDTASSGKKQGYGVAVNGTSANIKISGKLDGNLTGSLLKGGSVASTVLWSGIAEEGSNANGVYRRYDDGTQECWVTISATSQSWTTAIGALFGSGAAQVWTFPAAFVSTSGLSVTGNVIRPAAEASGVQIGAVTTSTANYYPWSSTNLNSSSTKEVTLTARGKWK
jgi:hypothetical protein